MSKNTTPQWILSADWGIDTDSFNWILYRKRGERWTAKGFYPSVESLLYSLYQKLTRTEPADPDLVRHVEVVSKRVEACAAALFAQLDARGHAEGNVACAGGGSMILSETIFIEQRPVGVVHQDSKTGQLNFSPIQGTSPLPDKRWRDVDELKQALFQAYREKLNTHVIQQEVSVLSPSLKHTGDMTRCNS